MPMTGVRLLWVIVSSHSMTTHGQKSRRSLASTSEDTSSSTDGATQRGPSRGCAVWPLSETLIHGSHAEGGYHLVRSDAPGIDENVHIYGRNLQQRTIVAERRSATNIRVESHPVDLTFDHADHGVCGHSIDPAVVLGMDADENVDHVIRRAARRDVSHVITSTTSHAKHQAFMT